LRGSCKQDGTPFTNATNARQALGATDTTVELRRTFGRVLCDAIGNEHQPASIKVILGEQRPIGKRCPIGVGEGENRICVSVGLDAGNGFAKYGGEGKTGERTRREIRRRRTIGSRLN